MGHRAKSLFQLNISDLSKWHDVMLNVRTSHGLGMFVVISNHNGDSWVELSYAVNQILKFVITQKCLCSYGDKGTHVVFWKMNRLNGFSVRKSLLWENIKNNCLQWLSSCETCSLTSSGTWVIELGDDTVTDFNSENRLVSISRKLHWDTKKKKNNSIRFELTEFPLFEVCFNSITGAMWSMWPIRFWEFRQNCWGAIKLKSGVFF